MGTVATRHWLLAWQPSGPLVAGLRCAEPAKGVGRVWETDSLDVQWRINNDAAADRFGTELKPSCACTDVNPRSFSLEPGGQQVVEVRLDLRPAVRWATDEPTFEEKVRVLGRTTGGETSALSLVAGCSVRRSYRVEPDGLNFGQVVQGRTRTRRVTVECLAAETVDSLLSLYGIPAEFSTTKEEE